MREILILRSDLSDPSQNKVILFRENAPRVPYKLETKLDKTEKKGEQRLVDRIQKKVKEVLRSTQSCGFSDHIKEVFPQKGGLPPLCRFG